jgi:mannosidase alpha-like ER degradation enhancer 2
MGGLLSACELSGDKRLLTLATDLGTRLLPAFNSPTGMPYRYVNLKSGKTRDPLSNPAEIGTYLIEFGKLTQLTGDSTYYKAAKKAAMEVYRRRSDIDLAGTTIDVNTGEWRNTESQIGARIDSYYEYLYKSWLLFRDKDCKQAWEIHNKAIKKYLLTQVESGWYFTRVDMKSGKETNPLYGALDAFYAGILALSGDIATAKKIQQGNYYMWTTFNLEPEEFNFRNDSVLYPEYPLRPENIESCFYIYRKTKDPEYQRMGQRMINDILVKCKTDAGYAAMKNVKTLELSDSMESFFFAETLKYSYLLFAREKTVDLGKVVFNTEAHPMRILNID